MKTVLATLLLGCSLLTAVAQSDKRLAKIEVEMNKILETWKTLGFAVAVVEKDKIIYAKGFGYSDYEKKIPADANTLYAIGSCSKAFTSALLGVLRNEKKVDFSERPGKYVPYLEFHSNEMNAVIQVRDLMTHTTGLPRHDFSWYLANSPSKDTLLMRVKYQEPFTGVREQWYYNNFMFLAQGVITEKLTGKTWEENLKEKFFGPLGMTRTNADIESMKKASNAALGYELKNDKITRQDYYDISGMAPAGSINSSVNEMAAWVITWINGGKYKGQEVIPAGYVSEAMSSHAVVGAGLPSKENPDLHLANYGYGWFLSSYRGHYRVDHGGNIDGFSANTSFYPSDSLGIIVLTNQNGSSVPAIVRNTLADRLLRLPVKDWNAELRKRYEENRKKAADGKVSDQVKGTHPSHPMVSYTGSYTNKGYGEFLIDQKNDSLFAHWPSNPKFRLWLKHHHYDVFRPFTVDEQGKVDSLEELASLRFNFVGNAAGEITKVEVNIEPALDHPIAFDRKPNKIDVDAETLLAYVGEYELPGMLAKVYTKNDTTLYVFVPGQPEYELVPTGKHQFAIKILTGFTLEFQHEKSGKFTEVIFKQPNGNFKATRKE